MTRPIKTVKRTKGMPKDARYVATDADGEIYTYRSMPMTGARVFHGDILTCIGSGKQPADFRTTLRCIVDRDPPKKPKRKMITPAMPDIETIRACLHYDGKTGRLFWRTRPALTFRTPGHANAWNARYAGTEAGTPLKGGYLYVRLNKKKLAVARVAWAITHGKWPDHYIDHINGSEIDNRISNLRDVPQSLNIRNCRLRSDNTSGACGAYFDRRNGKWCARINGDHLGSFSDIEAAAQAYRREAKKLGYTERHGTPAPRRKGGGK